MAAIIRGRLLFHGGFFSKEAFIRGRIYTRDAFIRGSLKFDGFF